MHFEYYQTEKPGFEGAFVKAGDWRWRLRAANGEPIAQGEGYRNKADCLAAIELVKGTGPSTPVKEVEK